MMEFLMLAIITVCLITIAVALTSYAKDHPDKVKSAVCKFLSGFIPFCLSMVIATVIALAIF